MMSDIHALSGAYAIDALDDLERAQFERHLAECAECRAEVDSLREASGLLAETTSVAPPPSLRDRVLGDIATVRPLPPLPGQQAESTDQPQDPGPATQPSRPGTVTPIGHRRRWITGLVAAAAVLTVIGAGTVAWHPWTDNSSQVQLTAAEKVLRAPDAERVTQTLPGGVEATLVRSKGLNEAVLVAKNMPPAPAGKVYELWFNDPKAGMVPAGLMPSNARTVLLDGDAAKAIGAGITVEPAGGSTVPTSEPVMLFSFENA